MTEKSFTIRCHRCQQEQYFSTWAAMCSVVAMGGYMEIIGCEGIYCVDCYAALKPIADELKDEGVRRMTEAVEEYRKEHATVKVVKH